jgi:hypothetical protein
MMHAKQQRASSARGALYLLLLLSSSGCALIAGISEPDDGAAKLPSRGSKNPDGTDVTSQGEGGATAPPPACLADTHVDTNNCGYCGHNCNGSSCVMGLCDATLLFSTTGVSRLSVDNDHVFFTTDVDVRSCAPGAQKSCPAVVDSKLVSSLFQQQTNGGGGGGGHEEGFNIGPTGVSIGQSGDPQPLAPRALALFGGRFFFADQSYGAIFVCPQTGCTSSTIGYLRPKSRPQFTGGLAIDAAGIVWGEANALGSGLAPGPGKRTDGDIFSGSSGVLADLAHDVTRIEMLHTGNAIDDLMFRGASGVFSLSSSTIPPREVLAGASVPDFAFDGRYAYAAQAGGQVIRFDDVTKTRDTLLTLEPGSEVMRLIADSKGVYAAVKNGGNWKLARVRNGGVDTLELPTDITALGLSASWVYYASTSGIWRVGR